MFQDTLFPYVRKNVESYVKENWDSEEFKTVLKALKEQAAKDLEEKLEGKSITNIICTVPSSAV